MMKWNRLDTDCKNKWAIFTSWISFTGPFSSTMELQVLQIFYRFFTEFLHSVWLPQNLEANILCISVFRDGFNSNLKKAFVQYIFQYCSPISLRSLPKSKFSPFPSSDYKLVRTRRLVSSYKLQISKEKNLSGSTCKILIKRCTPPYQTFCHIPVSYLLTLQIKHWPSAA